MTDATRTLMQVFLDALRVLLVYGISAVLLCILMANWALPYFSVMKPQLFLVAVFYWTLYRPTLMPSWVVFVAGILLDAISPVFPFGTHAASYLLIAGILKPRRRMFMGQPFIMVWALFVAATAIDTVFKYFVVSLFTLTDINIGTVLLNAFITVLSFPLILLVLVSIHRILPPQRGMMPG